MSAAYQGWPDVKMLVKKGPKLAPMPKDFRKLNNGALAMGLFTSPEYYTYRSMYDIRLKRPLRGQRNMVTIFPNEWTFGIPTR